MPVPRFHRDICLPADVGNKIFEARKELAYIKFSRKCLDIFERIPKKYYPEGFNTFKEIAEFGIEKIKKCTFELIECDFIFRFNWKIFKYRCRVRIDKAHSIDIIIAPKYKINNIISNTVVVAWIVGPDGEYRRPDPRLYCSKKDWEALQNIWH